MKTVEIKKTALVIEQEDWNRLGSLISDFRHICDTTFCDNCPLQKFCEDADTPYNYLSSLFSYLDNL